jgi:hypothetical protein
MQSPAEPHPCLLFSDVLCEIFVKLNLRSLLTANVVCRSWHQCMLPGSDGDAEQSRHPPESHSASSVKVKERFSLARRCPELAFMLCSRICITHKEPPQHAASGRVKFTAEDFRVSGWAARDCGPHSESWYLKNYVIPVLRASDKPKAEMGSETGIKMEAMLFREKCQEALVKLIFLGKCTDALGVCVDVPHFLVAAAYVDDTVAQMFPHAAPGSARARLHNAIHGHKQLQGDWVKAKIVAVHCLDLALQYHSESHTGKRDAMPAFNKLAYVDMQLISSPVVGKYVLDMQREIAEAVGFPQHRTSFLACFHALQNWVSVCEAHRAKLEEVLQRFPNALTFVPYIAMYLYFILLKEPVHPLLTDAEIAAGLFAVALELVAEAELPEIVDDICYFTEANPTAVAMLRKRLHRQHARLWLCFSFHDTDPDHETDEFNTVPIPLRRQFKTAFAANALDRCNSGARLLDVFALWMSRSFCDVQPAEVPPLRSELHAVELEARTSWK